MDPGPLRDLLTALLGGATGLLSGLFGVGGGVISQPGMRLLGLPPLMVIGTALPVIIPGAASGTVRYAREQLIRWRAVLATIPAGLVAAVGGGLLSEVVPGDGHLLQLATAGLLGFSAWRMSRPPAPAPGDPAPVDSGDAAAGLSDPAEAEAQVSPARDPNTSGVGAASTVAPADPTPLLHYVGIGAVSGLLSGLLGIGGGVLMVPAFVQLAGMQVKPAIATSLVCVGAFAVPGTVTHIALDHVDWRAVAALVIGVVPGARLGAALTIRAGDRRLRMAVGSFLGLTAVLYAGGEIRALADII
jgi:uncharacterized protein